MRILFKQLKKYTVETNSGVKLGYVRDVILEIDGHLVSQYEVRPYLFSQKKYLISPSQIIRFEGSKMVVDDNIGREKKEIEEKKSLPSVEPVMMREE